ncbi:outer membrane lipoprotein SlyB [Methanofollis sp. W23]|uniref:hypothetical protein n=1 Tax=Methanofollis sp. W23 TaxID=2817849 RepID=UPI001AE5175A|nr:hypothetical protein [Methanofollis sp. W23]MBP2146938.1 outer membrane lipoprotein SlyB [Methanofollis sp. W23]
MIEVKRLGVLSIAKVHAAIALVIGLIGSIFWIGMITVAGVAGAMGGVPVGGLMMTGVGGVLMLVFLVVLCTVIGFIAGAVIALIYNFASGWLGGIEVELSQ